MGRLGLATALLFSCLIAAASLGLVTLYAGWTRQLPSVEALPFLFDPSSGWLLQPTRLYDRTGSHVIYTLENPAVAERHFIPLADSLTPHLPTALVSTTLSTLDPQFWEHPGFTLAGWNTGDHPTLAQRLVSDLLLWDEPPGLQRNIRERLLAAQVTAVYGRTQVLEWYLNSAQFGHWIYGIDAAAQVYFGKSAAELTLPESALLMAVVQAPGIDPLQSPSVVLERQKEILRSMAARQWITDEQVNQALQAPVILRPAVPSPEFASVFAEITLAQISTHYPLSWLERGGHSVITTLDYALQSQVECVSQVYLERVANEHTLESGGDELFACAAAQWLPPDGDAGEDRLEGIAIAIFQPQTGELLAVGGSGDQLQRDALAPHEAGTALSPLIYLAALTRGMTPATLMWDVPGLAPQDALLGFATATEYLGPLRLRNALGNDALTPAVVLLEQIGAEPIWRIAQQLGLNSLEQPVGEDFELLTDGTATLIEMVQAYGALGNQGILVGQPGSENNAFNGQPLLHPVSCLRVENGSGNVVWESGEPQRRLVVSEQLAYLLIHAMSDESARWARQGRPNLLEIGRPVAAKNGLVSGNTGAWTVGVAPQIAVGVWVGVGERTQSSQPSSSDVRSSLAGAPWHAVMRYATQNLEAIRWEQPAGIVQKRVCDPSGLLPSGLCPVIVNELFLAGSEPNQVDNLYQIFAINRETGRLATGLTSPELIEERIFLVTPPFASDWARSAGLPMPPEEYEPLLEYNSVDTALLDAPIGLSHVHGVVEFIGSASSTDFAFYRLQAGQGLHPQRWLQITPDIETPVGYGLLGAWDTTQLSGLYSVRLMIVAQDQRIETAIIQLTIDNDAPTVQTLSPANHQRIGISVAPVLMLEASATDFLSLSKVEFYLDEKKLATFYQEPFRLAWETVAGEHRFRVRAVDRAGNLAEDEIVFFVED